MDWLYAILAGYALGSLPFAYWYGVLQNKNLLTEVVNLEFTSGLGVLGPVPALMVMLLDAAKGLMAVALGDFLMRSSNPELGGLLGGAFAVIGHCFSLWLLGRGGVGFTPAFGVLFAVNPVLLGTAVGMTALAYLLRRSLPQALLLSGLLLPLALGLLTRNLVYVGFGLGLALPMMLKLLIEQNLHTQQPTRPNPTRRK